MTDRTGADPHRLPDYADEPEITAAARAADLALLAEAMRHGRTLVDTLAELHEEAELFTTRRYFDLARDSLGGLADWFDDAVKELKAAATPAEEKAFRAEQAELCERLWRR